MKRFWMVHVEASPANSSSSPTQRHLTEVDALTEAARLVGGERRNAYVLEATYLVKRTEPPVVSEKLTAD